ncbi:hypothetical protein ACA910_021575 [Epithemia clementina (nom. ined.)]
MHRLGQLQTLVEIIPEGYTGKLQVMDVGVNRPFKKADGEEHFYFLQRNNDNNTPGTRILPTCQDVSHWINAAWKSVKEETIQKTWVHIGLCNPPMRPIDVLDEIEETQIQLGAEALMM